MEWDDELEVGASLSTSDVVSAVVGGVSIIGAAICALDRMCQDKGILQPKEKSPAKASKSSHKAK